MFVNLNLLVTNIIITQRSSYTPILQLQKNVISTIKVHVKYGVVYTHKTDVENYVNRSLIIQFLYSYTKIFIKIVFYQNDPLLVYLQSADIIKIGSTTSTHTRVIRMCVRACIDLTEFSNPFF